MDQYYYATMMFYILLSVAVVLFLLYVLPSLAIEIWDGIKRIFDPSNEWVERLLLTIEEIREWQSEPGRHRPKPSFGVELWGEVEEELRREIKRKVLANA